MESEIREQGALFAKRYQTYRDALREHVPSELPSLIVLVARGSSDNAALYARYLAEIRLGCPVTLAAPSVVTKYGARLRYPEGTFVIGVSQSGSAPDVAEMLSTARENGHRTLSLTNTVPSRLSEAAEATIALDAGLEKSVAATKTYGLSLVALRAVVDHFDNGPTPLLPDESWIETARGAAYESSGPVVRCAPLFALGRGYGFATAHEQALKLMECALLSCKAYSSADFEHGPKALAGPGSAAIVFGGDHEGLAAQGCEIVRAPEPHASDMDRPFYDAVFAQWLALAAARARGLDPDQPRHLKKVTETL